MCVDIIECTAPVTFGEYIDPQFHIMARCEPTSGQGMGLALYDGAKQWQQNLPKKCTTNHKMFNVPSPHSDAGTSKSMSSMTSP